MWRASCSPMFSPNCDQALTPFFENFLKTGLGHCVGSQPLLSSLRGELLWSSVTLDLVVASPMLATTDITQMPTLFIEVGVRRQASHLIDLTVLFPGETGFFHLTAL